MHVCSGAVPGQPEFLGNQPCRLPCGGMHAPAVPACSCSGMLTILAVPAAEEHLGDLAAWRKPTAGMFAWMKLQGGITDADQVIEYLKEEKVVVVPGQQP